MGVTWYYSADGLRHGPVSSAALRRLAADGSLSPDDRVWKEGAERPTRAGDVRGLFPPPPPGLPTPAAHASAAEPLPPPDEGTASGGPRARRRVTTGPPTGETPDGGAEPPGPAAVSRTLGTTGFAAVGAGVLLLLFLACGGGTVLVVRMTRGGATKDAAVTGRDGGGAGAGEVGGEPPAGQGRSGTRLTNRNYDRIHVGMSRAEVEQVLGPPTDGHTIGATTSLLWDEPTPQRFGRYVVSLILVDGRVHSKDRSGFLGE